MSQWLRGLWPAKRAQDLPDETPFTADAAIRTAAEDVLGRGPFAAALAKLLSSWRADHSLVSAIRGGWGEGKTSLKNLVLEQLRSQGFANEIVEFNPWQYGTRDAITEGFFREIAVALGEKDKGPASREAAFAFRRYARFFTGTSGGLKSAAAKIPNLVAWFAGPGLIIVGASTFVHELPMKTIIAILGAGAGVLALIGTALSALAREEVPNKPLDLVRRSLSAKLRRLQRPLIVVIDDIDRLDPDDIRTLFRHVKANADLPRLTYLLLFEPRVVEAALNIEQGPDGRAYMEKIVQAAFDLPAIDPGRIQQVFDERIAGLAATGGLSASTFQTVRWGNCFAGGLQTYLRTLRDVHRYMASATVQLEIHRGERMFEANEVDFLIVEALRVFETGVFHAIANAKPLLTNNGRSLGYERGKNRINAILDKAAPETREQVIVLIKQLFPTVEWAFQGGTEYDSDFLMEWIAERRICTAAYFDRYFTLTLPRDDISDSEFAAFLELKDGRAGIEATFAELKQRGLLGALLARLDNSRNRLPLAHIADLLPAIFDAAFQLGEPSGVSSGAIYAWRSALWYLRQEPELERRGQIFLAALDAAADLYVPGVIIETDRDARAKGESARLFSDDDLAAAIALWLEKLAVQLSAPRAFLANPHTVSLLFDWARLAGEDAPRAWVRQTADDLDLLVPLLRAFCGVSTSQTVGDFVAQVHVRLDLRALNHLGDLHQWLNVARRLDPEVLDETDKALLQQLEEAASLGAGSAGVAPLRRRTN